MVYLIIDLLEENLAERDALGHKFIKPVRLKPLSVVGSEISAWGKASVERTSVGHHRCLR